MVSQTGIKANPKKIRAILDMQPPRSGKEVQKLTRRVVAFNKFMLKLVDRCLSFFRPFQEIRDFEWTKEC